MLYLCPELWVGGEEFHKKVIISEVLRENRPCAQGGTVSDCRQAKEEGSFTSIRRTFEKRAHIDKKGALTVQPKIKCLDSFWKRKIAPLMLGAVGEVGKSC